MVILPQKTLVGIFFQFTTSVGDKMMNKTPGLLSRTSQGKSTLSRGCGISKGGSE